MPGRNCPRPFLVLRHTLQRSNRQPRNESSHRSDHAGIRHANRAGAMVREALFYGLFYVFLWRVVEIHLIYHGAGLITNFPSFRTTWRYFAEHLTVPGGLADYSSAFLSELFYYSWLGALAITVQAWLLGRCVAYLLRAVGGRRWRIIQFVPALLLAVLYGRYTYFFPTTLALLIALAGACAYLAVAQRQPASVSFVMFVLLSLPCYYMVAGAFLLFALVCVTYEGLIARRWPLSLTYAMVALALPFVVGGLGFSLTDVYSRSLPISWTLRYYPPRTRWIELVYALYLLPPAVMLVGGIWSVLQSARHRRHVADATKTATQKASGRLGRLASWYQRSPKLDWTLQTVLVLGVGVSLAFSTLDRARKNWFTVDYYAYREMWPEVLSFGRRQVNNRFVMHAVDRALYHTGRLGDELFRWPQRPEYLFLTDVPRKQACWPTAGLYLEMGLLNAAEHGLTECLEGLGDRPTVLQPLALVHLVKGDIGTARVYLGALRQTLFHHDWAERYLALLDTDPILATDERVQHLRALALDRNFPSVSPPTPGMFLGLLEKNPGNRIAFEYMMASHLLNKRLATFVKYVPLFERMDYAELPACFEEGLLTYVFGTRKTPPVGRYEPREALCRQTKNVLDILTRHGGDKRAALPELISRYGNTYIFYYLYAPPSGEQ